MPKLHLKKLLFSLLAFMLILPIYAVSQQRFLKHLIPDQTRLQYAGSIGYISGGIGYELKPEKLDISFHYGFVPKNKGGWLSIFSAKLEYKPFAIPIKDKIIIYPINPVFFPSYTSGDNFDYQFSSHKYRKGYYFWSSALRLHLGAGTEVKILNRQNHFFKSVSIFAESNTNDLYAISWFHNRKTASILSIFKMGYGVKVNF